MATNEQVASHLGISPTRISELKSAGILPAARRRANDIDACRLAYLTHIREVAGGRQSKDGASDLVTERARLAHAQALRAERENAVAEGEFLPRGEVHIAVTSAFALVRSKILALPPRMAPQMAPAITPAAAQAMLKDACYEALADLAATDIAGFP